LQIDPDLSSPYAILGVMQVVYRRYEEAIASARGSAFGPGDAETQIALGYVQLFAGNHAEAATAVETALRLDPSLSPIDREVAGLVFLLQGDTAKAIETLERACADAPAAGGFRITLAAAYARAGRLPDAQAAVADGLRLTAGSESPARRRSLSSWRIIYAAQFRNPQELTPIIDALHQAGLPEWPFGFTADEGDRLKGPEIASLVLGHTLRGKLDPDRQPAILQIGSDGKAGFRTPTRMLTETVYVDRDLLCEQSENMFGRPDCGPVFKRRDAGGEGYSYVNSGKVFRFVAVN
jgi:tetratricopeptide (TPR) repeat protein